MRRRHKELSSEHMQKVPGTARDRVALQIQPLGQDFPLSHEGFVFETGKS